jgi:putative ABC transport system permease protein
MFDLERAIKQWKQGLAANQAMEDGYVVELEGHLRDRIEELARQGVSPQDAFQQATSTMGGADEAGSEFYKAHTVRRSGRPPWQPPSFLPALAWNYFKTAARRIGRHKGFSFINIAGMTVGLTSFILILTFVRFELSFDRFHEKADRVYRFTSRSLADTSGEFDAGSSDLLAPTLEANVAAIGRATRVMDSWEEKAVLLSGRRSFLLHGIYADEHLLKVFSFPLLQGNRHAALSRAGAIVLSESAAKKLFGAGDPIGRRIDYREMSMHYDLSVTAVMKDIPRASHLQFDYVISIATLAADPNKSFMFNNWRVGNFTTYIELLPGHAAAVVEEEIGPLLERNWPGFTTEPQQNASRRVVLQPLTSIHLRSAIEGERASNQRIQTVRLFILVAVIILLLACFNFTSLSTARSVTRAKEVGLRKVVGAKRSDLVRQFVGESILLSLLSLTLALALAMLLVERFGSLLGVTLISRDLFNPPMIAAACVAALLAGAVSGIYPGIVLSGFKPAAAARECSSSGSRGTRLRRVLVVLQFSSAIVLIIGTLVIFRQLRFIRKGDLGYNRERVAVIAFHDQETQANAAVIKTELLSHHEVAGVTVSGSGEYPLSVRNSMGGVKVETDSGEVIKTKVRFDYVDEDFVRTMGLTLAQGRNFSPRFPTDAQGLLVNETLVRQVGWKKPLGKKISLFEEPYRVLGVVRDFHFDTLHSVIKPAVLIYQPGFLICVRLRPGNFQLALAVLKKAFSKAAPDQPFDYFFLDDAYNELYRKEQKIGEMVGAFSMLAVFIACLGLFGLAAFMAEQKTKEIGIRKVLGASMRSILVMLNKEFVCWVLLANLLAWPLAYFAMKGWLRDFAYRISLGWGTFVMTGLATLLIALLTVSYQALKAARANPVDSLRYE